MRMLAEVGCCMGAQQSAEAGEGSRKWEGYRHGKEDIRKRLCNYDPIWALHYLERELACVWLGTRADE